ncbi:MAG: FeoB small GTPase domain-containing protein [Calditrichota bacterium]
MAHNHSTGASKIVEAGIYPAIALVGNPNVGKSVLFGHLTGSYANVSNYPGTTVEVTRGKYTTPSHDEYDGETASVFTLIDTPGINNLIPSSEDEQVTRDILLSEAPEHVVQVVDTKNLRRGLLITLQLAEMQVPFTVCLNMVDEAHARGIQVDSVRLSRLLGVDVVDMVATRRKGIADLQEVITSSRQAGVSVAYSDVIEHAAEQIQNLLAASQLETAISSRSLALMLLGAMILCFDISRDASGQHLWKK